MRTHKALLLLFPVLACGSKPHPTPPDKKVSAAPTEVTVERESKFASGKPMATGTFVIRDGKEVPNGAFKRFHENGKLALEMSVKDGYVDGVAKEFFTDGSPKSSASYKKGKKDGAFRTWYEPGKLASEFRYQAGERHGIEKLFYPGGKPLAEKMWSDGRTNGRSVVFAENGSVLWDMQMKNGAQVSGKKPPDKIAGANEAESYLNSYILSYVRYSHKICACENKECADEQTKLLDRLLLEYAPLPKPSPAQETHLKSIGREIQECNQSFAKDNRPPASVPMSPWLKGRRDEAIAKIAAIELKQSHGPEAAWMLHSIRQLCQCMDDPCLEASTEKLTMQTRDFGPRPDDRELLTPALSLLGTCVAHLPSVRKSKTAEAEQMTQRLLTVVENHVAGARLSYWNTPAAKRVAPTVPANSAGPTPPLGECCKQPDGLCAPDESRWAQPEWDALSFATYGPSPYTYEYKAGKDGKTFEITAKGDLDCDGEYSELRIEGRINPDLKGNESILSTKAFERPLE